MIVDNFSTLEDPKQPEAEPENGLAYKKTRINHSRCFINLSLMQTALVSNELRWRSVAPTPLRRQQNISPNGDAFTLPQDLNGFNTMECGRPPHV